VLHAGLHYAPGSSKTRLAREGLRDTIGFCGAHGIAHERCGKLVIASNESAILRLKTLMERVTANELEGLPWIGADEIRSSEPHAMGLAAVHVPEEGVVDYAAVCSMMPCLITERGGTVHVGASVTDMRQQNGEWTVTTTADRFTADRLVT
jgi:L-2-hydroxyglutarate oxidase